MTEVEKVARCHNIKCWPEPFEAMKRGEKTAEFRLNDRDYRVGDTLLIREWCPATGEYTHREIHRSITHVLSEGFGLPKGYVMLSLAALDATPTETADERQAAIVAALRDDAQRCDCFGQGGPTWSARITGLCQTDVSQKGCHPTIFAPKKVRHGGRIPTRRRGRQETTQGKRSTTRLFLHSGTLTLKEPTPTPNTATLQLIWSAMPKPRTIAALR